MCGLGEAVAYFVAFLGSRGKNVLYLPIKRGEGCASFPLFCVVGGAGGGGVMGCGRGEGYI